jgi:hypothetical protein
MMQVQIRTTQFTKGVNAWLASVGKDVGAAAAGLAREAFNEILETSPQYSGDFVANTQVSTGTVVPKFTPHVIPGGSTGEFQRGSTPAIRYAKSHARFKAPALGQSIFIHRTAVHDEPYSWALEKGKIALRPVNTGAEYMYSRATLHTGQKYSTINKTRLNGLKAAGL